MANFDVEAHRAKFPALKGDQVFLDNAGGSQVLGTVVEAISDYLVNSNVQFGGGYKTSQASSIRYDGGVAAGARFLNAQRDEVAYGPSTTQLLRNLSFTFEFQEGDEIVVSAVDHEANIAPWKDLAERQNLDIKWWVPETGETNPRLLPDDLKLLLSPRTRLVTCTHASNVLGTIHDVKAIAETVHATVPGALVCVDGVAYAPHRPVDVKALGVDFYVLSWYKIFGPHVAMLYGSREAQEQMRTLGHFFNPHATLENKISLGMDICERGLFSQIPFSWHLALVFFFGAWDTVLTTNIGSGYYELVQSIPAIVDYIGPPESAHWTEIATYESVLQSTILEYLNAKPEITVFGETSTDGRLRLPTVSFKVEGWDSKELVETLERTTNFGFRWGAFYSNWLVNEFFKLDESGVVRVSMAHYNTLEEIKELIQAIDGIILKKS
ncbi:hypothetical protein M426DRAFT_205555 [Hypoxylon sp. CI-4A]|nr:hypothetical protein M426DRAFT_205555 [Hypoxylon sp. CI-4A]